MPYSDAEIAAALVGPNREWAFRYDIYSGTSLVTSGIDVASCTIKCTYLSQGPNRTCDVSLGPDVVFDQLAHSLRVTARLKMPVQQPVINGDFETDITGWSVPPANPGTTIARSTAASHSGAASLAMTRPDVAASDTNRVWTDPFPVTPGLAYTTTAWTTGRGNAQTWLIWFDAANVEIDRAGSPAGQFSGGAFLFSTITATAPTGAVTARFQADGVSAIVGTTDFVDEVKITAAAPAGAEGLLWKDWVLGTFRLSSSTRRQATVAGDRPQAMTGYDYLLDFQEAKVLDRYVVASGAVVTTAVRTAIAAVGAYTTNILSSASTLPAAMEWEPGTAYLDIINDLLTAINYDALSVDAYGNPYSNPYVAPESSAITWFYRTNSASVIKPGVDTGLDLFSVPNVWLAFVSEPDRPTLRSVAINADAGSKTSTVSRGRQIVQIVDAAALTNNQPTAKTTSSYNGGSVQAVDQTALDALVLRAKSEASTIYETVRFTSGLMPFHGVGDALVINYGSGDGTYRETEWSMNLTAGGDMTHDCRRAVFL